MTSTNLLLALLVAMLVLLAFAIEAGRAKKHVPLVLAVMVLCLLSAVLLVFSSRDPIRSAVAETSKPLPTAALQLPKLAITPGDSNRGRIVEAGKKKPRYFQDCEDCPKLASIRAGHFTMGSPEDEPGRAPSEGPVQRVQLQPFALGWREVTRGEFATFVAATGYQPNRGCITQSGYDEQADWASPGFGQDDTHPVVCVSFADARAYTGWLAAKTGREYRLPSEAEWEYAARAGETGSRPEAHRDLVLALNIGRLRGGTVPAGTAAANNLGLVDMIGNASEYVADCWSPDLSKLPSDGRAYAAAENCTNGLARGGGWKSQIVEARFARRSIEPPSNATGFRVARTLTLGERDDLESESLLVIEDPADDQTASR